MVLAAYSYLITLRIQNKKYSTRLKLYNRLSVFRLSYFFRKPAHRFSAVKPMTNQWHGSCCTKTFTSTSFCRHRCRILFCRPYHIIGIHGTIVSKRGDVCLLRTDKPVSKGKCPSVVDGTLRYIVYFYDVLNGKTICGIDEIDPRTTRSI